MKKKLHPKIKIQKGNLEDLNMDPSNIELEPERLKTRLIFYKHGKKRKRPSTDNRGLF